MLFTARSFFAVAVVSALLTLPISAHAQTTNLGVANDFNIFVFGNHTQSGTDAEGRVAVGGNANYDNGYTVASKRSGSTTNNLIVGGNLTNKYNSVYGNTVVGGDVNWNTPSQQGNISANGSINFGNSGGSVNGKIKYGTTISGPSYLIGGATKGTTALPIDFAAAQTSLSSLSTSLAGYTANGSVTNYYGGITMTGTDTSLNVFNVDASLLGSATSLNINAVAGSTVLVNVIGSSASLSNFGMNINGTDKQNVLFNFKDATQVNLTNMSFNASILATNATVNTTYGHLNGTIVANSLNGTMESHDYTFKGNLTNRAAAAVPEAGTTALLLAAVPMIGMIAIRRKK